MKITEAQRASIVDAICKRFRTLALDAVGYAKITAATDDIVAALEASPAQPAGAWVDVRAALPPAETETCSVEVLMLTSDRKAAVGYLYLDDEWRGRGYSWVNRGNVNVTHWQPLPSQPEASAEGGKA